MRHLGPVAVLLILTLLAQSSPSFAQDIQARRPIHDAVAAIASRPLAQRVQTFGLAQNSSPAKHRHSPTFPIKVGAGIGCAAGAALLITYADAADVGPWRSLGAVGVACAEFGLVGAGIGYIIAALR